LKPKTINCYLNSIRGFYEYLIEEEQVPIEQQFSETSLQREKAANVIACSQNYRFSAYKKDSDRIIKTMFVSTEIYQNWQRTTGVSPWVNAKAKIGQIPF
jgi:hypothetical protein